MTKEDFNTHWNLHFPDSVLISHLFKQVYSDRWFRIHSLPDSKRYADNDAEWDLLLFRQNELMTDLFGLNTTIFIVAGEYNWGDQRTIHTTGEKQVFKSYSFTLLENIELFKLDSDEYDEIDIYRPAFAETEWNPNNHDKLLKEIASNNTRAFFVSFDRDIVIAPYDGGVDIVLKDSLKRDFYKDKYKKWLSERVDGL